MRVLAINDISCVGKCSLTVALPIIAASGVTCDILPTAILSTHTGGFTGYTFRDLSEDIPAIIAHWKTLGLRYDIIISGYLGSIDQIEMVKTVKHELLKKDGLMIVDPVMGDNGVLYSHFDQKFVDEMKGLCRTADVIVPNLTEATFLTDRYIGRESLTRDEVREVVDGLRAFGPRSVVITSGIEAETGGHVVWGYNHKNGSYFTIPYEFIKVHFPGTGDMFSAVLVGELLNGKPLESAVRRAMDVLETLILLERDESEKNKGIRIEKYLSVLNR